MAQITSEKNPRIQNVVRLREKSRERKEQRLFVIEGLRELKLAVSGSYRVTEIFYCEEFAPLDIWNTLKKKAVGAEWIEIGKSAYEKIALRESTEGVIAVAESRDLSLDKIKLSAKPLVLVVEGVEKPGNLGALLRTTDAAGIDAVIVCDPTVDIYNPNVIRSSLGCLFTQQVTVCDSVEAISFLKMNRMKIFAATPAGTGSYAAADFTAASAIVVGSEAEGLSAEWFESSDAKIMIPMRGKIDSLNVSASAAIILFEAVRQRSGH